MKTAENSVSPMSKTKGQGLDVSVIIPVWNRWQELNRLLLSLSAQQGCVFEIIVVDDMSDDMTRKMVRQDFPEVLLLENASRLGPSLSRNRGIMQAGGRYILFLDSDAVLDRPGILASLCAFYDVHPEAGCVGGERRPAEKGRVYGRMINCVGGSRPFLMPDTPGSFARCDFLATCCCMVQREVAQAVGGFDPGFVFGGEDKDLGHRVGAAGYVNYVVADGSALHMHSSAGRHHDETFRYHLTAARFAVKSFSKLRLCLACAVSLSRSVLFYLLLPGKVFFLRMQGRGPARVHWAGGWWLLTAWARVLTDMKKIRGGMKKNFLEQREP